jgi:hypothetical protein
LCCWRGFTLVGVCLRQSMGITGLLPLLSHVTKDVHLRDLQGLTVAVDAYVWLVSWGEGDD